mmetsp:Transcript_39407/g.122228  ORF Transcript_39407/g.122228 Transcript_39407/m.122228 type:complete len:468 (-) Transcript_39407:157-1560(-)
MVMTQKLLSRLFTRLRYFTRLAPPRRSTRRQFRRVSPTCCKYSKLMISSMRTVARRSTEGSCRKASSSSLRAYSSPCQLFGACSPTTGAPWNIRIHAGGSAASNGEPKAAVTPVLTKPLTPAGLRRNRWPLVCMRRSSRLAASRAAASTTFLGARGLPATKTEKAGSTSRWPRSHSTAEAMLRPSLSSGASAKRHAQDMTLSANCSSSGAPRSLPRRVPPASARPRSSEPPKAAICAMRRAASGPASVTASGWLCRTVSGTSTGGCGGKAAPPARSWRTIFFVSPGPRASLARASGLPSPRPTAAKSRAKRTHSCRPTPLHIITTLPGRSRSVPPAPSLQVKAPASARGASCVQRRCDSRASSSGSTSAPSSGPSGPSSTDAVSCSREIWPSPAACARSAQGSLGERSQRSRGTTAARRSKGPTPLCQYFSSCGACCSQALSSSAQAWMMFEVFGSPGRASSSSGSW